MNRLALEMHLGCHWETRWETHWDLRLRSTAGGTGRGTGALRPGVLNGEALGASQGLCWRSTPGEELGACASGAATGRVNWGLRLEQPGTRAGARRRNSLGKALGDALAGTR
jgi:hypothetical protein